MDRLQTINQARGFATQIKDRFDLTLECIRLFYRGETSPLSEVLDRYNDFFELFGDFKGYTDFFLLEDLIKESQVDFFLPFESFDETDPSPRSKYEYEVYMSNSLEFLERRNIRIQSWVGSIGS